MKTTKKKIFEVVFHGRGGQGAKSASQFLVEAAAESGKYIQAFPEFGPERRGAPVKAYARISDVPIVIHEPVSHPDASVVLDESLLSSVNVTAGLENGILIVNTPKKPGEIKNLLKFGGSVYTADASKIAIDIMGKDITNTPMLGALSKATGIVTAQSLEKRIRDAFLKKLGEKGTNDNISMLMKAFDSCSCK